MHPQEGPCGLRENECLSLRQRLRLVVLGSGLVGLLLTARLLQPDPSGIGTHRQLGFPPCTWVQLFSFPCPSCGMTTAWSHVVRGELALAAQANVAGMLLGLLAMVVAAWSMASAARGRWLVGRPSREVLLLLPLAIAAVALLDWLRKLILI